jgi:biotin operon repressor
LAGQVKIRQTALLFLQSKLKFLHVKELKTATYQISEIGDFFRVELLDIRPYDLEKDPVKKFSDVEKDVENITYDVEKDVEKKFNLSKNQILILKSLQKNKNLTQESLSEIVGITLRNIQNNMIKLKEKGVLKRIGPDKGGYWKVLVKLK